MLLTAHRDTASIQLKLLLPPALCDRGQVTSLCLASLSQKLLSADQYQTDGKATWRSLRKAEEEKRAEEEARPVSSGPQRAPGCRRVRRGPLPSPRPQAEAARVQPASSSARPLMGAGLLLRVG